MRQVAELRWQDEGIGIMRAKYVSFLCGVVALLIILTACASLKSREPRYEGKTLSVWVAELSKEHPEETSPDQGWAREGTWTNVVRGVGTNGLPYFLKLMTNANDDLQRYWGGHAIVILGPAAASAIPTLVGLLDRNRTGYEAARGLAAIGPAAVPALTEYIETSPGLTPARAIEVLGEYGPSASPAIPVLTQIIQSDSLLAWPAMQTLVEVETNQAVTLPLLALHIADTNCTIGTAYGLGRLGDAGLPMLLTMLTSGARIVRTSAMGALDPDFQKYSKDKGSTDSPGFKRLSLEYLMRMGSVGYRAYSQGDFVVAAATAAQYTNNPDSTIREVANHALEILRPLAETNVPQSKVDQQERIPGLPQP
jgi:hypothetical protein